MWNFMEGLENRWLLSGGHHLEAAHVGGNGHHGHGKPAFAAIHHGILKVDGSRAADTIAIAVDATDGTKLDVTMNGTLVQFNLTDVHRILVTGGKGDDNISVDPSVSVNARLIGNSGNDFLSGGSGNDLVLGGGGNDTCSGGLGDDVIVGGGGTDAAYGGGGSDTFSAGDSDAEKSDFNAGEGDKNSALDDDGAVEQSEV